MKPDSLVCRVCLVSADNMCALSERGLQRAYELCTGLQAGLPPPSSAVRALPAHVCSECAARLRACARLRARAHTAHALLTSLLRTCDSAPWCEVVRGVDRARTGLASPLLSDVYNDVDIPPAPLRAAVVPPHSLPMVRAQRRKPAPTTTETVTPPPPVEEICVMEREQTVEPPKEEPTPLHKEDNTFAEEWQADHYSDDDTIEREEEITKKAKNIPKKVTAKKVVNKKVSVKRLSVKKVSVKKEKVKTEEVTDIASEGFVLGTDLATNQPVTRRKGAVVTKLDEALKGTEVDDKRVKQILELFTVRELTYEEQAREYLERLQADCTAPFTCRVCREPFYNKTEHVRHEYRHSERAGTFECRLCRCRCRNRLALRGHFRAYHTQRFHCRRCEFTTPRLAAALSHVDSHAGNVFECQYCGKPFPNSAGRLNHIRNVHATAHVCRFCGDSFASEWGLRSHSMRMHLQLLKEHCGEVSGARGATWPTPALVGGAPCPRCNIRFHSTHARDNHMALAHKVNVKRGRPTDKEPRSRPHTIRGRGGDYTCDTCGLTLRGYCTYWKHVQRHAGDNNRRLMCDQCGLTFQSRGALVTHMWRHSGLKQHACPHCGKRFSQKPNLDIHVRRVHGEGEPKWHECPQCGKRLRYQSNLIRHMRTHSGVKNHKCGVCEKTFGTKCGLQQHMSHVHLRQPWPKRVRERTRGVAAPASSEEDEARGGSYHVEVDMTG